MPWRTYRDILQDQLVQEMANYAAQRERVGEDTTPHPEPIQTLTAPRMQTRAPARLPSPTLPMLPQLPQIPQAVTPAVAPVVRKPSIADIAPPPIERVPVWQRLASAFTAPFEWIDDKIIKPALGIVVDAAVPNVERKVGEDYFSWKGRSWEEWHAPGFTLKMPWGDWRVDVKGFAELAPWLLIPGVGQAGGIVKGVGILGKIAKAAPWLIRTGEATGIAGKIASIGRTGTILNKFTGNFAKALQVSPWGISEGITTGIIQKAAAPLLKGFDKASQVFGRKLFGEITDAGADPAIQRLHTFFSENVASKLRSRRQVRAAQLKEVRKKIGRVEADYQANRIGVDEYSKQLRAARAGLAEFGSVPEAIVKEGISPEDYTKLREIVGQKLEGFEAGNALDAIENMVLGVGDKGIGTIAPKSKWLQLGKALGPEFTALVRRTTAKDIGTWGKLADLMNLPRAVLASWDMSAPARQGLILSLMHPTQVPKAMGRMFKAFASEKWALDMDGIMRARSSFPRFEKLKGYVAPMRRGGPVQGFEETFLSEAAMKIPGVRRSERAFNTYLNQMRLGSFESFAGPLGVWGADKEMRTVVEFINAASGRGSIPKSMEKVAPIMSALLFSPRLQLSRLQAPKLLIQMLKSDNPYIRKQAAYGLGKILGAGASVLSLFHFSGAGKVDMDPRSVDFGKVKIGETRLDFWTGYAQYARFIAQIITGEKKTSRGNMTRAERDRSAWRFIQSKGSPAFGLFTDIMRGEDYMGEPLFDDTTGALNQARNRLIPLFVQDMWDAADQGAGANEMLAVSSAFFGVGVLTMVDDLTRARDQVAQQELGRDWEDLDPIEQKSLEKSPKLQVAVIQFDRQIMGIQWGDWHIMGKAIEETRTRAIEDASAEFRETGDGVLFRDKVDKANNARRGGYDTRERMPEFADIVARLNMDDPVESAVQLGPEELAIRQYNDAMYDDDMYDKFNNYLYDRADQRREELRLELGDELFDYVEEFRGMKDATLPHEYQLLTQARIALRPYWDVEDEVIAMRGQPRTQWQKNRIDALVSKIKKRLLQSDREMAKWHALFYKRPPEF